MKLGLGKGGRRQKFYLVFTKAGSNTSTRISISYIDIIVHVYPDIASPRYSYPGGLQLLSHCLHIINAQGFIQDFFLGGEHLCAGKLISLLRGSGDMLPQKNFEILSPLRVI